MTNDNLAELTRLHDGDMGSHKMHTKCMMSAMLSGMTIAALAGVSFMSCFWYSSNEMRMWVDVAEEDDNVGRGVHNGQRVSVAGGNKLKTSDDVVDLLAEHLLCAITDLDVATSRRHPGPSHRLQGHSMLGRQSRCTCASERLIETAPC